jgi:hypothetical protein
VIIKGEASVGNRLKRFELLGYAAGLGLVVALVTITSSLLLGSTQSFSVPDDVAPRIRLDDTPTSTDSEVGDPFSATVVDQGDYRNARVYGHITQIDMSGKIKGHTSMVLRFDRLVMPGGRRAPIHAEIVELITHPPAKRSMWRALSNQAAEAARPSSTQ